MGLLTVEKKPLPFRMTQGCTTTVYLVAMVVDLFLWKQILAKERQGLCRN